MTIEIKKRVAVEKTAYDYKGVLYIDNQEIGETHNDKEFSEEDILLIHLYKDSIQKIKKYKFDEFPKKKVFQFDLFNFPDLERV